MAQLRAAFVLIGFLAWTGLAMPVQFLLKRLSETGARYFPQIYFMGVCWILGIRIRTHGNVVRDRPLLIAANHTSYFDIVVLGATGQLSFISKSEVAEWPLFGVLAKLARTVFVERDRRARTAAHRDIIHSRLMSGDALVLFPEGTSSDGNRVLPFKSALIGAAQPAKPTPETASMPPILVQPVAVAYTRLHGLPMGRHYRPFFAWYGDMDLVPHLWEAFCLGPFDVDIHFFPPVTFSQFGSRKDMTAYCQTVVTAGVGHALAGREGLAAPVFNDQTILVERMDTVPTGLE